MTTGRGHFNLTRCERQSLRLMMDWMMANKPSAAYSPIRGSTGPDGKYGIWRWQSERAELAWTGQPRGMLVEFKRKDDTVTYGFVWNNVLREFNDALLPDRMGRGYFKYVLGIPMPKHENEVCRQNLRANWKILKRRCRRFVHHLAPVSSHTSNCV